MVAQCRSGEYAPAVMQVRSGWVVLGERQVFCGYCLLLPDPVVPDLNALAAAARAQFLSDMGTVGDALIEALDAVRVNYARAMSNLHCTRISFRGSGPSRMQRAPLNPGHWTGVARRPTRKRHARH